MYVGCTMSNAQYAISETLSVAYDFFMVQFIVDTSAYMLTMFLSTCIVVSIIFKKFKKLIIN